MSRRGFRGAGSVWKWRMHLKTWTDECIRPYMDRGSTNFCAFLYTATRTSSLGLLPMVPITALVHTHNDVLRIGRCLETLHPCDEIVIVDHGSDDGTVRLAREYAARIVDAAPVGDLRAGDLQVGDLKIARSGREEWILCLDPSESLTESLAASLFEWKSEAA